MQNSFLFMNDLSMNANNSNNMKFPMGPENKLNMFNNNMLPNNDFSMNMLNFNNPMMNMNNTGPFNYSNFQNTLNTNQFNTTNILTDTLESLSSPMNSNNPYSTFMNMNDNQPMSSKPELLDDNKKSKINVENKINIYNTTPNSINDSNNKKALINKNSRELLQCLLKKE